MSLWLCSLVVALVIVGFMGLSLTTTHLFSHSFPGSPVAPVHAISDNRSCYFYYKSTLRPVDRYWYGILNLLINQHIQKRVVVRVINMSVQNKSSRFNNNTLQSQLITLHNSLPTSQFRTQKFLMRHVLHVFNAQTMGVAGWGVGLMGPPIQSH